MRRAIFGLVAAVLLAACATNSDTSGEVDLTQGTAKCGNTFSSTVDGEQLANLIQVATLQAIAAMAPEQEMRDSALRALAASQAARTREIDENRAKGMYVRTWPDGRCEAGTGQAPTTTASG